MKKLLYIGVLFFFAMDSFSQNDELKKLEIIPPSPSAYTLGTYGQSNIGLFTGTVSEKIELLNFKTSNIQIPVSLVYSSNGLKVGQLENNVGMGWLLEAGGVITRTVNGKPDEKRNNLLSSGACNSQELINYVYNGFNSHYDTEPDIFVFNFLGKSGKFVMNDQKKVFLFDQEDLEIVMLRDTKNQEYFTIRDQNGVKYFFTQVETTTTEDSPGVVSAWQLTKIVDINKEEVYFEYDSFNLNYSQGTQSSVKVTNVVNFCSESGNKLRPIEVSHSTPYMSFKVLALKRIYSNKAVFGEVLFNNTYSHPTISIGQKLVSSVLLKDKNKAIVDQVSFSYFNTANARVFLRDIRFKDPSKIYSFDYYSPESFNRLNGNSDAWGFNSSRRGDFPDPEKNPLLIKTGLPISVEEFKKRVSTTDKYTDVSNIKAGMLKEIKYPTKGFTTFTYEPNDINTTVISGPVMYETPQIRVDYNSKTNSTTFTNKKKYENGKVILYFSQFGGSGGDEYPVDGEGYYFNLYKESPKGSGKFITVMSRIVTERVRVNVEFPIVLEEDTTYKLEGHFTGYTSDREASASVQYIGSLGTTSIKNVAVNGLRVKNISAYNFDNTLALSRDYSYTQANSSSSSGELFFNNAVYFTQGKELLTCNPPGNSFPVHFYDDSITIQSSSVLSLNDAIGDGRMGYSRVVETQTYNDQTSTSVNRAYKISPPDMGSSCNSGNFYGPYLWFNSSWDHGLLLLENSYDSAGKLVEQKTFTYTEDVSKRQSVPGVKIDLKYTPTTFYPNNGNNINPKNIEHLAFSTYSFYSYKHYLKSKATIQYEGSNKTTITENYSYNSNAHNLITQDEVITALGKKTNKYIYADDVTTVNSLPGGAISTTELQTINLLKKASSHRPSTLIQVASYKDDVLINTNRSSFKQWYNTALFSEASSLKGGSSTFVKAFSITNYSTGLNINEVLQNDGSKDVYLYGYDSSLIIAKIQNTTKEIVASSLGVTVANIHTINESKLPQINALRTNSQFKESQITTYEYSPMIGITKITDPKGISTSYQYNPYNQLMIIKDHQGNFVQEFLYNFKNI